MKKRKHLKKKNQKHQGYGFSILPVIPALLITYMYFTKQWGIITKIDWKTVGIYAVLTILGVLAFCVLAKTLGKTLRHLKYKNSTLAKVDKMSGIEFEEFLRVHFEKKGYQVKTTKKSNDYGADLLLKKKHETTIVQAKRYGRNIGIEAIQQAVAARTYYHADYAIVCTNQYFTNSAVNLANECDVELWDRETLFNGKF